MRKKIHLYKAFQNPTTSYIKVLKQVYESLKTLLHSYIKEKSWWQPPFGKKKKAGGNHHSARKKILKARGNHHLARKKILKARGNHHLARKKYLKKAMIWQEKVFEKKPRSGKKNERHHLIFKSPKAVFCIMVLPFPLLVFLLVCRLVGVAPGGSRRERPLDRRSVCISGRSKCGDGKSDTSSSIIQAFLVSCLHTAHAVSVNAVIEVTS